MHADKKGLIAVAMSGGVDSSMAAALLLEAGHEVIGLTMRLMPGPAEPDGAEETAQRVAAYLGIAHHVVDLTAVFQEQVVSPFAQAYAAGCTPNPCVWCNRRIKFGALLDEARAYGAENLATGHYARIERRGERWALRRARDLAKDQTYFLSSLTQEQLEAACFPLAEYQKEDVRAMARARNLPVAERAESQEICFVPEDDYGRFLEARLGPPVPGPILSASGEEWGRHTGLAHYTVGQRKGMGIAAPRPLYVLRLEPGRNALIVGFEEETYCHGLAAVAANWCAIVPPAEAFACAVQVRYRQRPVPCTVEPATDGFTLRFDTPQRGVAPGQWAVLYDGDAVLGNGVIDENSIAGM